MRTVLASAADARYGFHLLSMLGSVQRNSDVFDEIVVYDLGLSPQQRRLVTAIRGVEVREMPHFVPHWAKGFTWKPWIWTHVGADRLFYLDAGAMVLRSLEPVLEQIDELGYWVVSQGHEASTLFPSSWYELYGIDPPQAQRHAVAAGIIGFRTSGRFWDDVVVPTYEDCIAGRNLGFSAHEVDRLNEGLGAEEAPVLNDARVFRWDQSVLNARLLLAYPNDLVVADLYEYAGFRSPRDHPAQAIWSHRRTGDYRYLGKARYRGRARVEAAALAARLRGRIALARARPVLRRLAGFRQAAG
ncbi:MAG TPA: hypothetical protein VGG88_10940 [Gaiellaceae bacterium]